jgi:hypothetical protein
LAYKQSLIVLTLAFQWDFALALGAPARRSLGPPEFGQFWTINSASFVQDQAERLKVSTTKLGDAKKLHIVTIDVQRNFQHGPK